MQPLRKWQAKKAWRDRCDQTVQRPKRNFVWGKGAKLLLLVNQDDAGALSAARAFAKTCQKAGKEVDELCFTKAKIKPEEQQENQWSSRNLSFSGLPNTEAEQVWRNRSYDVVIHCSLSDFAPFDYLSAGLTAHRRIAAYDTALCAYDLVVRPTPGEGIREFLRQVVHYLNVLSPKYG